MRGVAERGPPPSPNSCSPIKRSRAQVLAVMTLAQKSAAPFRAFKKI